MGKESTEIFDYDLVGKSNEKGQLIVYTGKEAIANSIIMWLTSFRNDKLRNPYVGGYITQHLFKPMSTQVKRDLLEAITDGINQDYTPSVTLKSLQVIPDYENKQWTIYLIVYSPLIKEDVPVTAVLKNFV
jgi:hypothetical protein